MKIPLPTQPAEFQEIALPAAPHPDDILEQLDPEQRQVASAPRGPLCVLAGAGTGKTRALTHRIAYLVDSGQVTSHHASWQ